MPKSDSILKFRGTIEDLTFVKSTAYGDHVRAKRGTHKKAKVNKALKQESKMLLTANVPAKIFKDAIDPYRSNMPGGMLWQHLVSTFRKQVKENGAIDFGKMEGFEIHEGRPFSRYLLITSSLTVDKKNGILHAVINSDNPPKFGKVKEIDGYRLTVIAMFPNMKKKTAKTHATISEVIPVKEALTPWRTSFEIPAKATSFVVCVKIEGCFRGVVTNMITTTGMCVVGGGVV